uniref:Serpentine receptor class gamma n=1 Tax=Caenorhabditis tropicalis TaxID=1561998 RepID=A0A1I7UVR2_9PELO
MSMEELLRPFVGCDSGESDTVQIMKFCLQLAYVLPFGFLYLSFMITIVKRRKDRELFEDSFFTLHIVDGIITLYFLISDIGFFRLTSYVRPVCEYLVPILKDPSYKLTPFYTLYMYAQLAKMLSTLAMSINRYTSVNNPVHHKMFWLKYCNKIIITIFIIPVFCVWPVVIGTTSFMPLNGTGVINYEHKIPWARTTYGRLLVSVSTLVFTIFSSIVTSSKLRKIGGNMKKVEFSMNVATVFTACGFFLVAILQVIYLTVNTETMLDKMWIAKWIMAATQIGNDFYMLSGPVVLIILDKRMRSSICCCIKKQSNSRRATKASVQPITMVHSNVNWNT